MLKFDVVSVTARTVALEVDNEECFYSPNRLNVYVNDEKVDEVNTNVFIIRNLMPNREYSVWLEDAVTGEKSERKVIRTKDETAVVNVKDFGAKGDGVSNDTSFIQAAIYACPPGGRVVFPQGIYLTAPVFLKSDITLELQRDAIIRGVKERELYPILPGALKSEDGEKDFYLASWEGNSAECFASLITGINVENVVITGEGTIDGNASFDTWWHEPKVKRIAWRPRTIFLSNCKNVLVEGITVKNSPSWTIHPLRCKNMKFIGLNIENPKDSPNTDGLNPESCDNVLILGVRFSVGDDCVAIKAGKRTADSSCSFEPSKNISVRNCLMEYGHGGVVIGSEMSGGVADVHVEKCIFNYTDRGIRIKTRRGRGGYIDGIYATKIKMNGVGTPFTINSYYFCDPDGKTEYVWSKEKLPVDERTPHIGGIHLNNITCINTQIAAAFIYGLPEAKIDNVVLKDIYVHFDVNAQPGYAEMLSFIEPMCRNGFYINNVKCLEIKNVKVENQLTDALIKLNIDEEHM